MNERKELTFQWIDYDFRHDFVPFTTSNRALQNFQLTLTLGNFPMTLCCLFSLNSTLLYYICVNFFFYVLLSLCLLPLPIYISFLPFLNKITCKFWILTLFTHLWLRWDTQVSDCDARNQVLPVLSFIITKIHCNSYWWRHLHTYYIKNSIEHNFLSNCFCLTLILH